MGHMPSGKEKSGSSSQIRNPDATYNTQDITNVLFGYYSWSGSPTRNAQTESKAKNKDDVNSPFFCAPNITFSGKGNCTCTKDSDVLGFNRSHATGTHAFCNEGLCQYLQCPLKCPNSCVMKEGKLTCFKN